VSGLHTNERRSGLRNAQEQPELSERQRTSATPRGPGLTIRRTLRGLRRTLRGLQPARSAYRLRCL
jgi:hypothetical protein